MTTYGSLAEPVDPWAGTDEPDTALAEEVMPTVVPRPYPDHELFLSRVPAPRAPEPPRTIFEAIRTGWRIGRGQGRRR